MGGFKPNVPFECFQSIKKAKRARKVNLDVEQICPAWKLTTWHVDTKHGRGLQFYLKLLKYYLKTFADLLIVSQTVGKSSVPVLGQDFYSLNLPLLSRKRALWEPAFPGTSSGAQKILEGDRSSMEVTSIPSDLIIFISTLKNGCS